MNIEVCDNIKDMAIYLYEQIGEQMSDPETTERERNSLEDARVSMVGVARFLMQAISINAERTM